MSTQSPLIPFVYFQIDAFRNFLIANGLTPYVVYTLPKGLDPILDKYTKDGQLVLNLSERSTGHYEITDDGHMALEHRFGGKAHRYFLPVKYLQAMYAFESPDIGISFSEDIAQLEDPAPVDDSNVKPLRTKPTLTVVK